MKTMLSITHIDTACVLLEINGYRILTDPTLDHAGHWYYHGYGGISKKTDNPAIEVTALGQIDLVLLSHHQHKDNFNAMGKRLTSQVKKVISTHTASQALPNITGLGAWETTLITDPRIRWIKITATPAQHRPSWIPEFISGPVIGFIIEFYGQERGVIYITGDTVYFRGIEEVGKRYTIDLGIYHVGKVQFPYLTGLGKYTMDGHDLVHAIRSTQPRVAIPIHYRGWSHFREDEQTLRSILNQQGKIADTVRFLTPGERTNF